MKTQVFIALFTTTVLVGCHTGDDRSDYDRNMSEPAGSGRYDRSGSSRSSDYNRSGASSDYNRTNAPGTSGNTNKP